MWKAIRTPRALAGRHAWPVLLLLAASAQAAASDTANPPEEVVITAVRMAAPLVIETDPRKPRQPVPAHDGADYLKTIPGFSVVRKGGTSADPMFRGMAASRVSILLDGEQVLGGCGMRMDPPTAYVFPEAYDRIVVVKGPQTVLHGPGNSAATVIFDRADISFTEPGYRAHASVLAGSSGRIDLVSDLLLGTTGAYARLTGTHAESDDYTDGDGQSVHSRYRRWSADALLGWKPGDDIAIELGAALSDGEAAYADREMDGVQFAREKVSVRFEQKDLTSRIRRLEAQAYYNHVDHVMDNFTLRRFVPSMNMPGRAVSNPDRRTAGLRVSVDLAGPSKATATVGLDGQENRHTQRSTMDQEMQPYQSMARAEDARFRNVGAFGELTVPVGERARLVTGLRADYWEARDARSMITFDMMSAPNPTAGAKRTTTLTSGFSRVELDPQGMPATLYAGIGHVERFPDYWELVAAGRESETTLSAFFTRPEKTTQLDVGWIFRSDRLALSLSGFYSDISDYVLIQTRYPKGMRSTTVVRNIDASTWGGEADATYALSARWKLSGTLAYTHGENDTDGGPLAQMPPLELRAGLEYSGNKWSAGLLTRLVAAQDRVAPGQGNIVGQDLGPTGGFAVFSLNGGWRPARNVLLTAGIDNIFDRTYAEHLSRGGGMVAGFEQTLRVNEPGRTWWLKAAARFE